MKSDNIQENTENRKRLTSEIYDLYAPHVYGKILSIVPEGPIAEKIFEKVFVTAYTKKNSFTMRGPLLSLVDSADDKSHKTIKALEMFNACCSGSTVSMVKKNN